MPTSSPAPDYRFGRFELQPAAQRLLVEGEGANVGPRAFDLLVALVERAGQLVSKAELLDRVWPGLVVEENNLHVQVSALRKILGPEAIATVPGRGYRFTLPVEPRDPSRTASPSGRADAQTPSIAVLPFVNLSDDAANEYFADGLSEELLNVLSKIGGLRVASRTSAFSFKGARVDIPTIARKLNVATVLEGSVRKAGSRVRVTAQLVEVATDSHLWSQTYDRELEDIFAVQDDIAQSVVREIRSALLGARFDVPAAARVAVELKEAARGRSRNAEAYRLYLQGSFFLRRDNEEDVARAIGCFRRALELDPEYPLAWASLSFCYLHQGASAWAPFAEGAERARSAAQRALALEPDLAAGHWAMGAVHMYYDWDWIAAESSIRRALRLAPEDGRLSVGAATLLHNLGHRSEAEALVRQALLLDPLNVDAHLAYSRLLAMGERLSEAESACRTAIELGPQRALVHYCLSDILLRQGRIDDALGEARREVHAAFGLQAVALAQLARGREPAAGSALRQLMRKHADVAAYQIAQVYAKKGDPDRAFAWLERARAQHDAGLPSMQIDPLLRGLHGDPRWKRLLTAMRFAPIDADSNARRQRD